MHPLTGKNRTGFISKTLRQLSLVLEYEFYSGRYVNNGMLLQSVAPVVKLILVSVFLVFTAATGSILILFVLALIAFMYAGLSGLPSGSFFRRAWAYLPVMVFLCSLPGASSILLPGRPLLTIIAPGAFGIKDGLYFTASGIRLLFRLALRPGVSLSFVQLLLLTTSWSGITGALSRLHVPPAFVSILDMTYRYIFIMVETAEQMMEARFLRTVGSLKTAENRKFIGHSTGYLFMRSFSFSEAVYEAIRCRSFSDKPGSASRSRICVSDGLFIASNVLILIIVYMGEKLF